MTGSIGRGSGARRLAVVAAAVVGVALVGVGGTALPAERATYRQTPVPAVGRTSTVCAAVRAPGASPTLGIVAVRAAPGREGTLSVTTVGQAAPSVRLTEQGRGREVPASRLPMVVQGAGALATASSGEGFSRAASGELAGLMAAPCTAPGTTHWFVGVGSGQDYRSELVLTNPDEGQAEVDLRFYGRDGLVVVPGSPGLVIPGHGSRTVGLESLARASGPLTVAVRASAGRVSAVAVSRASAGVDPVGADYQVSSVAPANQVIIPGVPDGPGSRRLLVVNPGPEQTAVAVEVLGIEGSYAPAGAATLEVPPESTAEVELRSGLAGQPGSVRLTSDQPVTGAVVSRSEQSGARPDVAVQSATSPVLRTGVVPLATTTGVDSELTLSNGGEAEVNVSLEVLSYAGVSLRTDDVLLVPHATATRRITSPAPSYLVVTVPTGSRVYGGLTYTEADRLDVAGLATAPLTSPDVASRAPETSFDPTVGR